MKSYEKVYHHFTWMITRARSRGIQCAFTHNDYAYFKQVIGPIPKRMNTPSVGRFNHSKGYVYDHSKHRWNFRWQELRVNQHESLPQGSDLAREAAICPHCRTTGQTLAMQRWHFNNCKGAA